MKVFLVCAIASIVLVVGYLSLRGERASEPAAPSAESEGARTSATPETELSVEMTADDGRVAQAGPALEAEEKEADPLPEAPGPDAGESVVLGDDLASTSEAVSMPVVGSAETDVFQKRYSQSTSGARKLARDKLQAILDDHRSHSGEKGRSAMSDEDVAALQHEIAWLRANP